MNHKAIGQYEVSEMGIERIIDVSENGVYISELIIPKEIIVEAYKRFIKEDSPQGEWIYKQYGGYPEQGDWYCSECDTEYNYGRGKAKFCPNCGAKMRKEQE